jgi:hypothetical protein
VLAVTYVFILEIGSYPELNLPSSLFCSALVVLSLRKHTPTYTFVQEEATGGGGKT